jgi:hypothetical protein
VRQQRARCGAAPAPARSTSASARCRTRSPACRPSGGIDLATGYFKSFGQPGDGPRRRRHPGADRRHRAALRQGGQDALARQHQLARQQEQLERELAPLLAERERSTSARARVSTVQVTLAAPQGGELRLSYAVRGPGWQPAIAPRWTAPRKSCSSAPGAGGAKHGRGLDGVAITLSTGQPGAATQGPLPPPWRVGVPPQAEAVPAPSWPRRPPRHCRASRQVGRRGGRRQPRFDVSVFQGSFATEFAVPQRVTVPSSGERSRWRWASRRWTPSCWCAPRRRWTPTPT